MKKKLLSLIMVFVMCLTMLPTAAFAADGETGDTTVPVDQGNCMQFFSGEAFGISAPKRWNGTIEYSTNAVDWTVWDGSKVTAAQGEDGQYHIFFRGKDNTVITGQNAKCKWVCDSTDKVAAKGNIMTLLDYTAPDNAVMGKYCFANIFMNWKDLTNAPELPATTLSNSCYNYMFSGCTGLTETPKLPATTLAQSCYAYMFDGCTGLTETPSLPATTLAEDCYLYMFLRCSGLTNAPKLPATTLAWGCYKGLFYKCKKLTNAPELPATTLAGECYRSMFSGCTGLTETPSLPATTLADNCYANMFDGCTGLTNAPELPATTLAEECYAYMFSGCTGLTNAPELPATTLAGKCYRSMFSGCTGLTSVPELPATTLAASCYLYMFRGCTGLTSVRIPDNVTRIDSQMFDGCSSIKAAYIPETVTEIGDSAFAECPNLTIYGKTGSYAETYAKANDIPFLDQNKLLNFSSSGSFGISAPKNWNGIIEYSTNAVDWTVWDGSKVTATQGEDGQYRIFFRGKDNTVITGSNANCEWVCDSTDKVAAKGNIMTLLDYTDPDNAVMGEYCFANIFMNWKDLTNVPELPATTLAEECYVNMFRGCTGLTSVRIPDNVTRIDSSMFNGCSSIKAAYIPETVTEIGDDAFAECPNLTIYGKTGSYAETYAKANDIPFVEGVLLNFRSSGSFGISAPKNWNGIIEYSTNTVDWTVWDGSKVTAAQGEDGQYHIFFRGKDNTVITGSNANCEWVCDSTDKVAAAGNIMTLLDYTDPDNAVMGEYCFANIFMNWKDLTNAPELPATELADSCYAYMFMDCTGLTSVPELPATTLAEGCYRSMFRGCTGLTETPSLPAMTLAEDCYVNMFRGCTGLTSVPELPATTLAAWCYENMFIGCTGLTSVRIPDNVTRIDSYMFNGCSSIKAAYIPETVTEIGDSAFAECPNLTIYGKTGSYAETYAKANDIPFVDPDTLLNFSSSGSFGISASEKRWKGIIEYSTNAVDWTVWDGSKVTAAQGEDGQYHIFFQGKDNTVITSPFCKWVCDSTDKVAAKGNIMTLLDYTAPDNAVMGEHCFKYIFMYWDNLTNAPELPATTLSKGCYKYMFRGCTRLTKTPSLPATTLAENCYENMFSYCTGLTETPSLPATTLAARCYANMFDGCTGLTNAPKLPATTLAAWCYENMFSGCTGLTSVPELPATELAEDCYANMFGGCTGLTETPSLPATTLAVSCYAYMFMGCTGLTETLSLPATTLAENCYGNMFRGCTGLTETPSLPATTLAARCYSNMFGGCTGLTSVPELPATELADRCYAYMFSGCTGLTSVRIPDNVTRIDSSMFNGCSSIKAAYIPETVTEIGDDAFAGCPNLTIYGKTGSYAETYAKANDIPFVYVKEPSLDVLKTKTESGITYTVTATNLPTKAVIVVAMYKDGKYVGCETADYTGEELNITTQISHDSAKIMAWENLANMTPILPVVEK